MTLQERFEDKYIPDPNSGCWHWTAYCNAGGYGVLGSDKVRKKTILAHRVSWTLHYGDIPDGMKVCHTCDVPSCVNPDHLFLGTQAENIDDMAKKGRRASFKGVNNTNVTLNEIQVRVIRRLLGFKKQTQQEIGDMFGVNQAAISKINRGLAWGHI